MCCFLREGEQAQTKAVVGRGDLMPDARRKNNCFKSGLRVGVKTMLYVSDTLNSSQCREQFFKNLNVVKA